MKHCCSLKYHFLSRGYPSELVDEVYSKAKSFTIDKARQIKETDPNQESCLFMIITYHAGGHTLQDSISPN